MFASGPAANLWTEPARAHRGASGVHDGAALRPRWGRRLVTGATASTWSISSTGLPAEFRRYRAPRHFNYSDECLASARSVGPPYERHMSQETEDLHPTGLVLSLEDDRRPSKRAARCSSSTSMSLLDSAGCPILSRCPRLKPPPLGQVAVSTFTAPQGSLTPSNSIPPGNTAAPAGELEVRLDAFRAEPPFPGWLPLAKPAADNDAVDGALPALAPAAPSGPHELCFRFTPKRHSRIP